MNFLGRLFGKGPKLSVNEKGEVYPMITEETIFTLAGEVPKLAQSVKLNRDGSGMILFDDLEVVRARERRKREREEKKSKRTPSIPIEFGDAEPPL